MNRQRRRPLVGAKMAALAQRIVEDQPAWEDRWDAFRGVIKGWVALAARDRIPAREVFVELGGQLARRIMNRLDSPPIRDLHQALFYRLSADRVHVAASEGWQMIHPDEMEVFQAQYPDIQLLRTHPRGDQRLHARSARQRVYRPRQCRG